MKCLCTTCALTCTRVPAPLPEPEVLQSHGGDTRAALSISFRGPSCLSRCLSLLTRLSRKPLILLHRQHLPRIFPPMHGRSFRVPLCVCLSDTCDAHQTSRDRQSLLVSTYLYLLSLSLFPGFLLICVGQQEWAGNISPLPWHCAPSALILHYLFGCPWRRPQRVCRVSRGVQTHR